MLEESIPSLWTSLQSWFTPTVLFLLLNLVIGTIAVISKSRHRSDSSDAAAAVHPNPPSKLARAPSLVLERLKSINFYSYFPSEPHLQSETLETIAASPVATSVVENHHHISRCQSDTQPTAGEAPPKLAAKMTKSASEKSAFAHFEAAAGEEKEEVVRRPATARPAAERIDEGDQVDARADDFINRFRQQLKLQRLDSIVRYKEMLKRGN